MNATDRDRHAATTSGMLALSFLVAMVPATNYTLNHFYVAGGYLLDSGWFAYLFSYADSFAAHNPPMLAGSYFTTHFSPIVIVFSRLHGLLSHISLTIPPAIYFSLIQGLWFGLMSMATFMLFTCRAKHSTTTLITAGAVSVFAAFNGVAMAIIGFPHAEIAMPVLLMLHIALRARGHALAAALALFAGLLVREDAGLHYACLLSCVAICLNFSAVQTKHNLARGFLVSAMLCLAYSACAMSIQKLAYAGADNALQRIYLGSPPLAHVTLPFILEKIRFLLTERAYLLVPIVALAVMALATRNLVYLAAPVAVLPWIALSMIGVADEAGHLSSYYAFPIVTCALWIPVNNALQPATQLQPRRLHIDLAVTVFVTATSIGLFAFADKNHDSSPWKSMGFAWYKHVAANQQAADELIADLQAYPRLMVDDAVASLVPARVSDANWRYQLQFPAEQILMFDAVAFMPQTWLTPRVSEILEQASLHVQCKLGESDLMLACRSEASIACRRHCARTH